MNEMKEIIKVLAELMSDHEKIKSDVSILKFEVRNIKNKLSLLESKANEEQ